MKLKALRVNSTGVLLHFDKPRLVVNPDRVEREFRPGSRGGGFDNRGGGEEPDRSDFFYGNQDLGDSLRNNLQTIHILQAVLVIVMVVFTLEYIYFSRRTGG